MFFSRFFSFMPNSILLISKLTKKRKRMPYFKYFWPQSEIKSGYFEFDNLEHVYEITNLNRKKGKNHWKTYNSRRKTDEIQNQAQPASSPIFGLWTSHLHSLRHICSRAVFVTEIKALLRLWLKCAKPRTGWKNNENTVELTEPCCVVFHFQLKNVYASFKLLTHDIEV